MKESKTMPHKQPRHPAPRGSSLPSLRAAGMALFGSTDPFWLDLPVDTSLSPASPVGQAIQETLGQGVSWVLVGVVALVGLPWLIAAMALAASFLRPSGRSSRGWKQQDGAARVTITGESSGPR